MSHRAWAAENLLTPLREAPGTIGESHAATTLDSCLNLLQRHSNVMAKAPWSSSGRGVRPLSAHDLTPSTQGWLTRIIADQGADQCGFCNPGFVMNTIALLREIPDPTDDEIRAFLAGNLCRCSGYEGQLRGIRAYLDARSSALRPDDGTSVKPEKSGEYGKEDV